MPILKSASKKLRQSLKRRERNLVQKRALKKLLDGYRKKPTAAAYSKLVSALDKAAKKNLIHKNKSARLKSRLSKLIKGATFERAPAKSRSSKAAKPSPKKS